MTPSPGRWRALLVATWLLTAALWSPWGLDWLLGEGQIEEPSWRTWAGGAAVVMMGGAVLALLAPLSKTVMRAHTALIMTLLVGPILGEGLLRLCLAADLGDLRQPKLFADPYTEDDHWKLKRRWGETIRTPPDPLMGWSTPKLVRNPLGVLRPFGYEPQTENVVLCFGDSFMAGRTPHPGKIPDLLEERLGGPTVYNYGVGGFGVGQMYLRFREAYPAFVDPVIVVGLLTRDLDRTVLSVRGAPKPSFEVEGGELLITPPTLVTTGESWDALNPPSIRSYLLAMVVRRLRRLAADGRSDELMYGREKKCLVNSAVLEALVAEARAHDLQLVFVSFPPAQNFGKPSWRDEFLQAKFKELRVPFVQGRKALRADMKAKGLEVGDYYLPDNHPNEAGNRVFADAIAARLEKLWASKGR